MGFMNAALGLRAVFFFGAAAFFATFFFGAAFFAVYFVDFLAVFLAFFFIGIPASVWKVGLYGYDLGTRLLMSPESIFRSSFSVFRSLRSV